MGLKINGSTSGSIEIDVPAVAGTDTSITIPAKNGGTFIVEESTGNIDLGPLDINGSASDDSVNIDSSGRLLVGTSTQSNSSLLTVEGNTGNGAGAGELTLQRGEPATSITSGESLGHIYFNDNGGNKFAEIAAWSDAGAGSGDYPGRLVFSTTADGASSPTARMTLYSNGNIRAVETASAYFYPGIDNSIYLGSPSFRYNLVYSVNGTASSSDEREKTEISNATLGTDFIKSLRPVSYKWIEGGKVDSGELDENGDPVYESVPGQRTHWGFIAQEVKQAADDAGVDFGGWILTDVDDPESPQGLRYQQFIAPLTKALQEAIAKIETLETANASLEARLTALEGGAS